MRKASRTVALSAELIGLARFDVVCSEVGQLISEGYPVIHITGYAWTDEEEKRPEWEACRARDCE